VASGLEGVSSDLMRRGYLFELTASVAAQDPTVFPRRWLKQPRMVFYTTPSKIIFTTLQKM
jgi:hypothetical protein